MNRSLTLINRSLTFTRCNAKCILHKPLPVYLIYRIDQEIPNKYRPVQAKPPKNNIFAKIKLSKQIKCQSSCLKLKTQIKRKHVKHNSKKEKKKETSKKPKIRMIAHQKTLGKIKSVRRKKKTLKEARQNRSKTIKI